MKKCLLVGINAKYIHSNLAIRYLHGYSAARGIHTQMIEFSINDTIHSMIKNIVDTKLSCIAFSCYIWNIELVLKIVSSLRKINPSLIILLGGPEVSFDSVAIMEQHPIDYILCGEGEPTFVELMQDMDPAHILGLTYRDKEYIVSNPERPLIHDLDSIPRVYGDLSTLKNKIIYYETSRGCPFQCKYCLSSTIKGVRFFSMDRVKEEFAFFIANKVKQIKLVDRTFNCSKKRCVDMMQYIISLDGQTNFHFEVSADLIDDAFIETIAASKKDTFQLEIGVQSTNKQTLDEISRHAYLHTIDTSIKRLLATEKVHIHLDLIAGLPYEDLESFQQSFNETIALKPQMLQLGFLKLLKGSALRHHEAQYGYQYHDFAPYEIISSKWLSYSDVLFLKDFEELLELYYNSGRFTETFEQIRILYDNDLYGFFKDFVVYWHHNHYFEGSRNVRELYSILFDFTQIKEELRFDFMTHHFNLPVPTYLNVEIDVNKVKELLNNPQFIEDYLPMFRGISYKEMNKQLHYSIFGQSQSLVFFIQMIGSHTVNHLYISSY